MTPTTIEHAFRNISLQYTGERLVSDFELEALKKYYLLHDQAWQLRELLRKSIGAYTSVSETLQQCRDAFEKLQQEYTLLLPMLDYIRGTFDVESTTEESVGFDTTPLMTALNHFQDIYIPLYDRLNHAEAESAVNETIHEKTEQEIADFGEKYFSPIIRDWENMEIDTVSLDKDWNNYRTAYEEIDHMNDDLYDLRETVIEAYTTFNTRWAVLYTDLEKFFAELKKLDAPSDLN